MEEDFMELSDMLKAAFVKGPHIYGTLKGELLAEVEAELGADGVQKAKKLFETFEISYGGELLE